MRQALLACVAVLGLASTWALPLGAGPIPVYGVVDKVIDGQLETFRDNYQSELVKQLNIEPHLADKLILNLGFDEYRSRLKHIGVKNLLDHPVIVLMRMNPEEPNVLSVFMAKEGIAHLGENPLSVPILDALRSGDNVPVVFSPALLPADSVLTGLQLDQFVVIVSKTLNIPSFARLAISFSDIPWLLVQPKILIDNAEERGLKEIGVIEVVGDVVTLVSDMSPHADVSELRTPNFVKKVGPVLSSSVGTMRDNFSFLNWPALNLPAFSDVPAIVLNFPLNIIQSLLDYVRERPPVSVKPIVNIPTVKPATEPPPKVAEAAKPEGTTGAGSPDVKPEPKPEPKPERKAAHHGDKHDEKMLPMEGMQTPASL